jgi:hypothetical protein
MAHSSFSWLQDGKQEEEPLFLRPYTMASGESVAVRALRTLESVGGARQPAPDAPASRPSAALARATSPLAASASRLLAIARGIGVAEEEEEEGLRGAGELLHRAERLVASPLPSLYGASERLLASLDRTSRASLVEGRGTPERAPAPAPAPPPAPAPAPVEGTTPRLTVSTSALLSQLAQALAALQGASKVNAALRARVAELEAGGGRGKGGPTPARAPPPPTPPMPSLPDLADAVAKLLIARGGGGGGALVKPTEAGVVSHAAFEYKWPAVKGVRPPSPSRRRPMRVGRPRPPSAAARRPTLPASRGVGVRVASPSPPRLVVDVPLPPSPPPALWEGGDGEGGAAGGVLALPVGPSFMREEEEEGKVNSPPPTPPLGITPPPPTPTHRPSASAGRIASAILRAPRSLLPAEPWATRPAGPPISWPLPPSLLDWEQQRQEKQQQREEEEEEEAGIGRITALVAGQECAPPLPPSLPPPSAVITSAVARVSEDFARRGADRAGSPGGLAGGGGGSWRPRGRGRFNGAPAHAHASEHLREAEGRARVHRERGLDALASSLARAAEEEEGGGRGGARRVLRPGPTPEGDWMRMFGGVEEGGGRKTRKPKAAAPTVSGGRPSFDPHAVLAALSLSPPAAVAVAAGRARAASGSRDTVRSASRPPPLPRPAEPDAPSPSSAGEGVGELRPRRVSLPPDTLQLMLGSGARLLGRDMRHPLPQDFRERLLAAGRALPPPAPPGPAPALARPPAPAPAPIAASPPRLIDPFDRALPMRARSPNVAAYMSGPVPPETPEEVIGRLDEELRRLEEGWAARRHGGSPVGPLR